MQAHNRTATATAPAFQQRCHKLWEKPRPLHQTIAFLFIFSNGGITTTASAVSSAAEKMGDECAEHSSHRAESLQLHRLPLCVSLPQQRRGNITRHHFRPPPAHGIQGLHCPIREANGLVPSPTRKSAVCCTV